MSDKDRCVEKDSREGGCSQTPTMSLGGLPGSLGPRAISSVKTGLSLR